MSNLCGFVLLVAIFVHVLTVDGRHSIPRTSLFTDTEYQIHQRGVTGFNILTYADIETPTGAKYVQLDDHANRESLYAPGGQWFLDGLWKFILLIPDNEDDDPYVTIQHVLYPDRVLALNTEVESPGENAPALNYLILTSDPEYIDQGDKRRYAYWYLAQDKSGSLSIQNLGKEDYATVSPRSSPNDFYEWVTVTPADFNQYNFIINGV